MTEVYAGSPELTDEQRAVVDLPAEAKALITAAAGSGKTHTLVRRLDALIADHGLAAGEILVLSFSRAAVRDLSARLVRDGEAARFVRAQTFDSWALLLLSTLDATVDWSTRSFDERIRAAEDLIGKGAADPLFEDGLLHLVIDEAQDLVGARRDLVESLLTRYDCGFTVVGDLAQAIYGFQVADPVERAGEAGRFVQWLRQSFEGELTELGLTRDFRARTAEAETGLGFGAELRETTARGAPERVLTRQRGMLRAAVLGLVSLGDPATGLVRDALREFEGTTAVLCRTNGEALVVSETLRAGGVPHRLQASGRDRVTPGWLADLFPEGAGALLTRDEFERLLTSSGSATPEVDLVGTWASLSAVAREGRSATVARHRLAELITTGRLPDELTAPRPARLIVSSIHRAKGLEFDRVIITEPASGSGRAGEDVAEETRLLYVAMTRARDDLLRMAAPDTRLVRRVSGAAGDRWGRYGWKAWMRPGLELRGGDVESETPAGFGRPKADPAAIQAYLRSAVSPDDEVTLERDEVVEGLPDGGVSYRIMHRGNLIGSTSTHFSRALSGYSGRGRSPARSPRSVTGGHIEYIEAVRGGRAAGTSVGAGDYGVWLAPRLGGLTRFEYDRTEASDGDE
jgi:AAA domain/UvrD-like helicase C-terminal domain